MTRTRSVRALRRTLDAVRRRGKSIVFVPTMGALHAGHRALIERAAGPGRCVVVSIFVNPLQFGPREDFGAYPRTLAADLALCRSAGADVVFLPTPATMYPDGFATTVHVDLGTTVLCAPHRPGHFDGVTTVVLKLLNLVQPDRLLLGQKDAQQAVLVGKMIADLDLPVVLEVVPTVREADGLAMSSRNRYLDAEERAAAPALQRALREARRRIRAGERNPARVLREVRRIVAAEPRFRLQYAEIVDARTLEPCRTLSGRVLVAAAAFLGRARLIDNVVVTVPAGAGTKRARSRKGGVR
jgi:pantoate--beta-alanine ligase